MEMTVFNPQNGRYETLDAVISEKNTSWFNDGIDGDGIYLMADIESGLLIQESGYSYPILFYDLTREKINYSPQNAKILLEHIDRVVEMLVFDNLQDNLKCLLK